MAIAKWIRNYLGISDLENDIARLSNNIGAFQEKYKKLHNQIEVSTVGIGRIISKIDPIYAQHEIDNPERKAASDKLGQEVIDRLIAENAARHHQTGDE